MAAVRATAVSGSPVQSEAPASGYEPTVLSLPNPTGQPPTVVDAQELGLKRATLLRPDAAPKSSADPAQTYIGCVIDERYVVEAVLGKGGMGVVYRARHQVIDRLLAIKILLPNLASDPEVTERFVTEARSASAIGNQHIVDITDFGQLPDGSTYFVMEYLEGWPLSRVVREQAPLDEARVLRIGQQIARALSAAHAVQIVHRDLKPDNIFLLSGELGPDYVKVLDFGIAKVARGQNKITRAGTIFGTPHYMSPEQASGSEVSHQSDIYSFGILLYEMATREVPFDAESPMGLLTQHLFTAPPPPSSINPEISAGLEAVILKCLAKEPEHRFVSMSAVALELEFVEKGVAPTCLDELRQAPERFKVDPLWARQRFGRRRGLGRLIGVGVAAIFVGAGAVVLTIPELGADPFGPPLASVTPEPSASVPTRQTARPEQGTVPVAVVVSPIDARVFQGGRDLGTMPVTVPVLPGRPVQVEVRREGFHTQRLTLTSTKRRVVVELSPVPGVKPQVPVPEAGPLLEDAGLSPYQEDAGTRDWVELDEPAFQQDPPPAQPDPAPKPSVTPPTTTSEPQPQLAPSAKPPPAPSPSPGGA